MIANISLFALYIHRIFEDLEKETKERTNKTLHIISRDRNYNSCAMNPCLKLFSFPVICERIRSHRCIVDILRNRIGPSTRVCVTVPTKQSTNLPVYLAEGS